MEPIVTIIRRRRLKWYENLKVRHETGNSRAVAEMMMEGKRPRGSVVCDGRTMSEEIRKPDRSGRNHRLSGVISIRQPQCPVVGSKA